MNTNPYTSASARRKVTHFCGGIVTAYNPDKRLYTVDVDLKGETRCKQIESGVLKPYDEGTRVLVGYFPGSEWTIIGEMPKAAIALQKQADSEEETLARGRGRLQETSLDFSAFVPSYRTVDSAGEAEVPVFAGDARIENRVDKHIGKSFLQIFKFGDILAKSSSFCYIHLHKLRSTILMKSRNFRLRFAGYFKDVVTPAKGTKINRTTIVEEIKANPLASNPDIQMQSGDLSEISSYLVLGTETNYLGGFEHVDLTNNTKRLQLGTCTLLAGSLSSTAPSGQLTLTDFAEDRGISLQTSSGYISMYEDGSAIVIEVPSQNAEIKIEPQALTLKKDQETIELSPSGTSISATRLDIDVTGDTSITTGGNLQLRGARIDLN